MRVRDLKSTEIKVGLQIKSLVDLDLYMTVIYIDSYDDNYAWIISKNMMSGFYGNDCDCEVLTDKQGNPIYTEVQYSNFIERMEAKNKQYKI